MQIWQYATDTKQFVVRATHEALKHCVLCTAHARIRGNPILYPT